MDYIAAQLASAKLADWIGVVAFAVAALLCRRAAMSVGERGGGRERWFWFGASALLLFFALNELLDLQTLLTAAGRRIAREGDWYRERRTFQLWFVVGLGSAVGVGLLVAAWLLRASSRWVLLALAGFVVLAGFDVLRAASMHHVDQILRRGSTGFGVGTVIEFAAIALIAASAYLSARPPISGWPAR